MSPQKFSTRPQVDEVLELDGHSLTIDDIVGVARHRRRVRIASSAAQRVRRCRVMVEVLLELNQKVYGLNTGFGKLRDIIVPAADTRRLQDNLIRSHACGVGEPFAEDVVRAAILLRANTLCRGNSGVRLAVLEQFIHLLNDDVFPFVPQKGSVGASGDLAPLSHLALVLIGDPEGRVHPREQVGAVGRSAASADFRALGELGGAGALCVERDWRFRPVQLEAKEGLALNNGTQFMTAVGALVVYDTFFTLRCGELACAMSLEANRGIRDAFDPRIHNARPQRHQAAVARRVIDHCTGSQILDLYLNSAHLSSARIHLSEAADHLTRVRRTLAARTVEAPASLRQADRAVARLSQRVQHLIPQADGVADAEQVAAWLERSSREQIAFFHRHTARCRLEISSLIGSLAQATFPQTPATSKCESALVEAQRQLKAAVPDSPYVQDDYSFRCFPQVLACAYRALDHVGEVITVEANSATDNPLLFPPRTGDPALAEPEAYRAWLRADPARITACREGVIGGGNFHGEPVAIAMDYLTIAIAEAGNIAERRVAHLIDPALSRGLPAFLIERSGLNSGFMIPQYTAAALVSENKVLAHPASVDSIPTCANSEDHVSMGTIAARQAAEVLGNVRWVLAVELLSAHQALSFRRPLMPGGAIRRVCGLIADAGILHLAEDRVLFRDMERMRALLDDPELWECALGDRRLPGAPEVL